METLKYFLLFCILYGICSTTARRSKKKPYDTRHLKKLFSDYVKKYHKKYTKSEYYRRFKIFKANVEEINRKNKGGSVEFDINKFTDMTKAEIMANYRGLRQIKSKGKCASTAPPKIQGSVPKKWDWRDQGVVSPVVDQGPCAACWAFAATGAIESQFAIRNSTLHRLSTQQLIDCSGYENKCDGGLPCSAISLVIAHGGMINASDYPYTGERGVCKAKGKRIIVPVVKSRVFSVPDEQYLRQILYKKGPLVVGLQAGVGFHEYKSGIATGRALDCKPDARLSHALLLVGYGKNRKGREYWILKNSFGRNWGSKGYLYIDRGDNVCKITDYVIGVETG